MYLLRAVVAIDRAPPIVVTVYLTSKVRTHQQGAKVLESGVKVRYDPEVDVVRILLNDAPIGESDEAEPGVILDYDEHGNVVGIEILDASKRMADPTSVEYAIAR